MSTIESKEPLFISGDQVAIEGNTTKLQVDEIIIGEDSEISYHLVNSFGIRCVCNAQAKNMSFIDINDSVEKRNIPLDSHESDLYILKTPVTEVMVTKYRFANSVTEFVSEIDNQVWYDVPFACNKFWDAKNSKGAKSA